MEPNLLGQYRHDVVDCDGARCQFGHGTKHVDLTFKRFNRFVVVVLLLLDEIVPIVGVLRDYDLRNYQRYRMVHGHVRLVHCYFCQCLIRTEQNATARGK